MDDIESTIVALTVKDFPNTPPVATTRDHDSAARVELDEVGDLAGLEVKLDGVVHTEGGVGVADGATVVGDDEGNALGTDGKLADLAEFVGGLFRLDAVDGEAALDVVKETEVLAGTLNGEDVFGQKV